MQTGEDVDTATGFSQSRVLPGTPAEVLRGYAGDLYQRRC
jgi:hypothetical protein